MALLKDGNLSREEVEALPGVPSKERLEKGPVVVVECAQEIPCNPCVDACVRGAIRIDGSITLLPYLVEEVCTGCGACIAVCPGQAIFVVDATYSATEGTVQMPYEYTPLPKKGDEVDGLNRAGQTVCSARVLRVLTPKSYDRTAIVTVVVPKEMVMEVRSVRVRR
jgi:Fe-S-cluster-containing hydrogenase component 2